MLQSQLFMLQVLVACMIQYWQCHETGVFEDGFNAGAGDAGISATGASSSRTEARQRQSSTGSNSGLAAAVADIEGAAKGWHDPPPLDDALAKQVLSVLTVIVRQTVAREDIVLDAALLDQGFGAGSDGSARTRMSQDIRAGDRTDRQYKEGDRSGKAGGTFGGGAKSSWDDGDGEASLGEGAPLSALALINGTGLFVLHPNFPPSRSPFTLARQQTRNSRGNRWDPALPRFKADSVESIISPSYQRSQTTSGNSNNIAPLIKGIYRLASQVIFYLSSSNWQVLYARVRNRLTYLRQTTEELPNPAELRLLECSNLQRARLATVCQELCSTFLQLKRNVQQSLALILRRTVWAWIQYHPSEFATLFAVGKRLEGGPDVLFDHVLNLTESSTRRKQIFWPMLTALLLLCPDIIGKAAVGAEGRKSGSLAKKVNFIETIRKGLKQTKLSDIAALCLVDVCKAAASTTRAESSLRLLAHDVESELKDKLFDPVHPLLTATTKSVEVATMVDAFVAFFRLDPQKTMLDLVAVCTSSKSPIAFRVVLVKACIQLASERGRLPWNPDVSLLYPKVSALVRTWFKDIVYRWSRPNDLGAGGAGGAGSGTQMTKSESKRGFARSVVPTKSSSVAAAAAASSAAAADEAASRLELLQSILQLWLIDPASIHHGMVYTHSVSLADLAGDKTVYDPDALLRNALQIDSVVALVYTVCRSVSAWGDHWKVHEKAIDVLELCCRAEAKSDASKSFFAQAGMAFESCQSRYAAQAADILAVQEDAEAQRHWLRVLQRSMHQRVISLDRILRLNLTEEQLECFLPASSEVFDEIRRVEKAILLTACTSDVEVCSEALHTCKLISRLSLSAAHLYPALKEMADLHGKLGGADLQGTGRIAQQKKIRALLREADLTSLSGVAAWREAFRRWEQLTLVVARPLAEESPDAAQEKAAQWHNYTGFLCALGGVLMRSPTGAKHAAAQGWQVEADSSGVSNGGGPNSGGAAAAATDEGAPRSQVQTVEGFVQELVDLLVSDSIWVREKVKEMLGNDLSSRLYGILFRMIHGLLSDFFDQATGTPRQSDMFTIFVDHSVSVMQMVLDRMKEPTEGTLDVDIGAVLVLCVEYLNSLSKRDTQGLRIKTSLCQLCQGIMAKKAYFAFLNELKVRNRIFQVLGGWTTDSADETVSADTKLEKLQRELDVVCLETMSILLDKLPLLLAEDAMLLDDKLEWAKSRQYAYYFGYFIKHLNRARAIEEAAADERRRQQSDMASLSKSPSSMLASSASLMTLGTGATNMVGRSAQNLPDPQPLKKSAILALSNLLASNINTGLKQSLQLAYEEDPQLRKAFMEIMTNVLNQGTDFDDLERLTSYERTQSQLIDLITKPDLQLALAICHIPSRDMETMEQIMLSIFDAKGGIIRFLKASVTEEIESANSADIILRGNSFHIQLLSRFGRTHGYEYLRHILAPLLQKMAQKPRGYSFEMDPTRLAPGESVATNQKHLEETAQLFIDTICDSAHRVPAVLRELCRHIRTLMDRRFPKARYQGVGGFMILRFITPAIVSPENIDINLGSPGPELRKGLVLVSKILLTLYCNQLFASHKDPHLTNLNDFLKRNIYRVSRFLDDVSDARTDPERLYAADQPLAYGIQPFGCGLDQSDQSYLQKFLLDHVDEIGKWLLTRPSSSQSETTNSDYADAGGSMAADGEANSSDIEGTAAGDGKRVYEQLCMALADVQDARKDEPNGLSALAQQSAEESKATHEEFLRRHRDRNIDGANYSSIFREGGPSKANRIVFYYTLFHQDAQTLDYEGFILYVLRLLEKCKTRLFDLVVDCTAAAPNNMTPHQWITYFTSLLPLEVATNLRTVIVFNLNTTSRHYVRPWMSNDSQAGQRGSSRPVPSASSATIQSFLQLHLTVTSCNAISDLEMLIDRRHIALDPLTMEIANTGSEMRFQQVTMVWYYRSLIPVTFRITGEYLQIAALKPQNFVLGNKVLTNDVIHLADIDDVRAISIRGDDNTFFVTCRGGTISFLFVSRDRAEIVQGLRQAKARVSKFRAPTRARERMLLPSDVPGTLLNMAMLNSTSRDNGLRLAAYDLLCALSTSFSFGASHARKKLLSTKGEVFVEDNESRENVYADVESNRTGLALSANTMSFVTELSKDFAVAAPGVTLEFLLSFFEGFDSAATSQKTMCLQYMAPWLSNLVMFTHTARDQQPEYQKRIREILSHLIDITVKQPDMYATMQRCVWIQISKLDDLIPLILDVFTEAAMDSGLHSPRFESVLDTMVSFSSINLRGKLLTKLRRVIAKTAQDPTVSQLHDNTAWKEIATLVRMNMVLSFTSRLESQLYLAELLHVILLLAGNGVDATRHSIHGTAVNLMHSLCTEDVKESRHHHLQQQQQRNGTSVVADNDSILTGSTPDQNIEGMQRLRLLLEKFSDDEHLKLFGLPMGNFNAFDASPTTVRESPSNTSIEKLASIMYEIAEVAAPTMDAANAWRARLTSLVTSTAFQYNPIIQSRAFLLLGCLADLTGTMLNGSRDEDVTLFEVDDDLLYQILVSLRASIHEWSSIANDAPMISIIRCLSKVVKILPDRSRYLPQMFWIGVSMVQYGQVSLFKAGVELLQATVTSICSRDLPAAMGMDLFTFLLEARYDFRDEATALDEATGVDFESHFSFAMAALLVKGLRHPSTKECTTELLSSMLRFSALDLDGLSRSLEGRVSTVQSGFFIALLPTATRPEDFGALLATAGVDEQKCAKVVARRRKAEAQSVFSDEDMPDDEVFGSDDQDDIDDQTPAGLAVAPNRQGGSGLFAHLSRNLENKVALLTVTLLASLLSQAESTAEKRILYGFLADSAREFPAIVSILIESLDGGMRDVFENSQVGSLLDSIHAIAHIAASQPIFAAQARETARRGGPGVYLEETGYAALLDCGSFVPLGNLRRMHLAELSNNLLVSLIDGVAG